MELIIGGSSFLPAVIPFKLLHHGPFSCGKDSWARIHRMGFITTELQLSPSCSIVPVREEDRGVMGTALGQGDSWIQAPHLSFWFQWLRQKSSLSTPKITSLPRHVSTLSSLHFPALTEVADPALNIRLHKSWWLLLPLPPPPSRDLDQTTHL